MPAPTNKRELMSTIGRLTWIRTFCECRLFEPVKTSSFAHLLKPISELNKKEKPFEWTAAADKAFRRIKAKLTTDPVIKYADFSLPFTVTTDASAVGAGAVLLQQHPDGKLAIVATASKTFNATQQRWSTTEREAYCIVWAITEKFEYFLRSRHFTLFTDHRSLIYLDKTSFSNAKIARWQDKLAQFDFAVEYLEGQSNVLADMLSRPHGIKPVPRVDDSSPAGTFFRVKNTSIRVYIPSWVQLTSEDRQLVPVTSSPTAVSKLTNAFCGYNGNDYNSFKAAYAAHNMISSQRNDADTWTRLRGSRQSRRQQLDKLLSGDCDQIRWLRRHREKININRTRLLCNGEKVIIPYKDIVHWLRQAHNNNNHCGIDRVKSSLNHVDWSSKNDDIVGFVNSCVACAKRKGNYGRQPPYKIGHVKRGSRPFEVVFIDFITLPPCKGKRYACTILCSFSRFFMAVPSKTETALDAARALHEMYLRHRVIPSVCSSDRGRHFTSQVFKEFLQQIGTEQELHTLWRPESPVT